MNKTKIVATIGPSSADVAIIRSLIKNGMDVARINMKHATHEECMEIINTIENLNRELDTNVAIMLDITGPNLSIGKLLNGSAFLTRGDKIRIYMNEIIGDNTKFSVNYPELIHDVKYDSLLKMDDGLVTLKVLDKGNDYLLCEVLTEGMITNHKSVVVPGIRLNRPFLGKKDIDDIKFGNKMGVDFLALSFVESAENVLEVNDLLIGLGNDHIGIIAKIETEWGLDDLDEIIRVSEGVMVARGDLGVELPMERIPGIQKTIIHKCHMEGRISIVATELLSSMEKVVRPTRAEVSDVANAVLDGTDAVMLSGETTVGKYPVETLQMMEKIIASAEIDLNYMELLDRAIRTEKQDITGILAYNVAESATRLQCKAIITPTVSGYTARKISRFRSSAPIIAVSPNVQTVKSLALYFGVTPVLVEELKSFDKIIDNAKKIAQDFLPLEKGDKLIITGGYPFKESKHTNFMKIEEL